MSDIRHKSGGYTTREFSLPRWYEPNGVRSSDYNLKFTAAVNSFTHCGAGSGRDAFISNSRFQRCFLSLSLLILGVHLSLVGKTNGLAGEGSTAVPILQPTPNKLPIGSLSNARSSIWQPNFLIATSVETVCHFAGAA